MKNYGVRILLNRTVIKNLYGSGSKCWNRSCSVDSTTKEVGLNKVERYKENECTKKKIVPCLSDWEVYCDSCSKY